MPEGIEKRFSESFDANDREDIYKYLDWLRSTMSEFSQNVRRLVTITVFLIAVFEVIAQSSPKVGITISSFRIGKGSIALTFIPALVAYLFFQILIDSTRLRIMQKGFASLFKKWNAKAEGGDLDLVVMPPQAIYWSVGGLGHKANVIRSDKVEDVASKILLFAITAGTLLFEYQAYLTLFRRPLTKDIPWFISGIIAAFCLIMALAHLSSPLPPD